MSTATTAAAAAIDRTPTRDQAVARALGRRRRMVDAAVRYALILKTFSPWISIRSPMREKTRAIA